MKKWIFPFALLNCILLIGQDNAQTYQIQVSETKETIKLDGRLDEASWKQSDVANDFWERSPRDDRKADLKTEVRVLHNEQFLFVAFTCFDSSANHIVQTLKRDESFWDNDGVAVILDPIGERTNGFFFGSNTAGSQNEALIGGGTGEGQYSSEWDNKWFVETSQYENYWVAEFAIPFKTLRYDPSNKNWLINFARLDAKHNQMHVWARIPRQFWPIDLGYAGTLVWSSNPPKAKSNISLIPYISAGLDKDFEEGGDLDSRFSTGLDAKVALNSSLNLDLTVNPDFSQVEVDRQVTNLTRFSIFFPERRNFFLENSDLFSSFGNPLIRPFFSRRIGLNDSGQPIPIQFGARLSGNLNDNLRIGLMDVHTGQKGDTDAQNYFTAAFSHRLFKRSSIKGIFVNRQGFDGSQSIDGDYGRNGGLEFNYVSADGKFEGWASHHLSYKPGITAEKSYSNLGGSYNGRVFSTSLALANVGTDFFADVGFVNNIYQYNAATDESIRQGYKFIWLPLRINTVPKEQIIYQELNLELENFILYTPEFERTEANHSFSSNMEFTNTSSIGLSANLTKVNLQFPFSFTEGEPLPAGEYSYVTYGIQYQSDERKLFNYNLELNRGGFYNGTLQRVEAQINYRRQPWGLFSINAEFNDLQFPEAYGSSKLWLVGPRFEFSFSRNLFWTTFLQYNTQAENFNVNSRFQWQFQPLSWLYLVYTDNYLTTNWQKKNRALVFKLNYWLSI